jgi:hypothetical protein
VVNISSTTKNKDEEMQTADYYSPARLADQKELDITNQRRLSISH